MSTPFDSFARLVYIYLAEFILGFILFFIFRHFSLLYRRRFLYTWALSWLAFSVHMSTSVAQGVLPDAPDFIRFLIHVAAQLSCFLQVIMILRGTHEMVSEKALNRRKFKFVFWVFLLIAFAIVLVYNQPVVGDYQRHLLQLGSTSLTTGLGFLITGIVVWSHRKFTKGFGQRLLAISLVAFSFYQLYYFLVILLNARVIADWSPWFYEVADLLLAAIMGLGMVMWLLEDERQKLEKANKELDRFMYSTSHDLRAPIASILGLTYLGKLEFQEEKARLFMEMIEERIRKLDSVISDILSLSRTKKFEVKIEEVKLAELLEDVVADIRFNKNAPAITLDYQPDPSHVFKSDYSQMKIVLCNLMGNAVKYHNLNQPNPFIKVTFRRHEDYVEIGVEDNGQGIPEESLPSIFEMFYRASVNTEGTGLGLYIVNEALNKVKGSISVDSSYGKGSVFTIFLDEA
ncbi:MAG TPA: HAMP domain-containing sensor histidine kinase [Ohtaekwangia sp.]|nr:HAMP domain-containing sensor histidine kinase [Ohtaekwangia sp.]